MAPKIKFTDARRRAAKQRERDRAARSAGASKAKYRPGQQPRPTPPRRERPQALATAPPQRVLVDHADLATLYGIKFSRQHLWRLIRAGAFPAPVALSGTSGQLGSRKCWWAHDVEAWLAGLQYVT